MKSINKNSLKSIIVALIIGLLVSSCFKKNNNMIDPTQPESSALNQLQHGMVFVKMPKTFFFDTNFKIRSS